MAQKTWLNDSPYNMLDRNLRRLGLTMLVSSIVDIVLALVTLLFPAWVVSLMGVDASRQAFSLLFPLVHLVFPCFCVLAYMDTKRNVAIVAGALMARMIYALFMLSAILFRGARWTWAIPGGIALAVAIVLYAFLRLSDFGFWEVFSRAGNPPGMRTR